MAGATAPTTSTASAGGRSGRFGRTASYGGAENRKLNRVLLARALGAGDFLLLVDDDFLEFRGAIVANVFVDWHVRPLLDLQGNYSNGGAGLRYSKLGSQDQERRSKLRHYKERNGCSGSWIL